MKFSIIICTYNRDSILPFCLASFDGQQFQKDWEIIVIDNNSTDRTSEVVKKFQKKYTHLIYVKELKQGLSHARNRAITEASGEWIVYIDDDAKLAPGYIERLEEIIENYDFDCFGGMYYAWYHYGKPLWLPKQFGNKVPLRNDVGLIDGKAGWLSGGNFAIKKSVLLREGGFDLQFGMSGGRIGYGEEDHFQQKLLTKDYKIGFDPELIIDHAILPSKLKISWHLKNSYAKGRDTQMLLNNTTIAKLIYIFFKSIIGGLIKRLPLSLFKLLFKVNYYLENLLFDVYAPILGHWGSLKSKINQVFNQKRNI